jgi:hypothetical protein
MELNDFYNDGFGWICKCCERELKTQDVPENYSRLLREGESESKTPRFSNSALAKWNDSSHQELICPRCNITEFVDKS